MAEQEVKKTVAQENDSLKVNLPGFMRKTPSAIGSAGVMLVHKGIRVFKGEKNQLNVKAVNAVLFALTGILTLYYINGISVSLNKIKNINLGSFMPLKDSAVVSKDASLLKPFSFYLGSVKSRDIFRMGQKIPSESAEVISSKAAEASQTLKMVGISWSEQPEVMIEDTKVGKTYFVKKGQMVGDFRVEAIYKDKVTLRYGVENIDLR